MASVLQVVGPCVLPLRVDDALVLARVSRRVEEDAPFGCSADTFFFFRLHPQTLLFLFF